MEKQEISAIILIARSGAGKGTVSKELINLSNVHNGKKIKISVSDTTRKQKNGEIDGVHYNFISPDEFQVRKQSGYYIETDEYAGNWYGSPKDQYLKNKAQNIVTLYDVEANGAEALQEFIGKNRCKVFALLVPVNELNGRVKKRNRDSSAEQKSRIEADMKRIPKMLNLGIPITYDNNVLPVTAANEIYNQII